MAQERAPTNTPPISPFVRQCVGQIDLPKNGLVLDIPCGFGRHSLWLAQQGYCVVAADLDAPRVNATQIEHSQQNRAGWIGCLVADCESELPFCEAIFDMALVVHYYSERIINLVRQILKPNGYLIFETFGAHGQNWQSLPKAGVMATALKSDFEMVVLRERRAGPDKDRAVVRVMARKRLATSCHPM